MPFSFCVGVRDVFPNDLTTRSERLSVML